MKKSKKKFFSGKTLIMPKKTERGDHWDFPTSILSQNIKQMQGGPFREKNSEKKIPKQMSQNAEKN